MSIYHYYPSKAHLLDALFDRVIGGLPRGRPGASLAKAHEGNRVRIPGDGPSPSALLPVHRAAPAQHPRRARLARADALDLPRCRPRHRDAARFFRVVGYYVIGGVLDETSGYGRGHSAAEPVPDAEAARSLPAGDRGQPVLQAARIRGDIHAWARCAARPGRSCGGESGRGRRAGRRPARRQAGRGYQIRFAASDIIT